MTAPRCSLGIRNVSCSAGARWFEVQPWPCLGQVLRRAGCFAASTQGDPVGVMQRSPLLPPDPAGPHRGASWTARQLSSRCNSRHGSRLAEAAVIWRRQLLWAERWPLARTKEGSAGSPAASAAGRIDRVPRRVTHRHRLSSNDGALQPHQKQLPGCSSSSRISSPCGLYLSTRVLS